MAMTIDDVKKSLRITTTEFDDEIADLVAAAKLDLNIAGVELPEELDELVDLAIKTFVKLNFGNPENYDKLERSYKEQKAQLSMATGYTRWERYDG